MTGRPPLYTADEVAQLWNELIDHIVDGGFITSFCKQKGISRMYVWRLTSGSDDLSKARHKELLVAEQLRSDMLVDEIIEISDDAREDYIKKVDHEGNEIEVLNKEAVMRARLKVDTRKWIAGKQYKRRYGDSQSVEMSGPEGTPIQFAGIDRPAPLDYEAWKAVVVSEGRRSESDEDTEAE